MVRNHNHASEKYSHQSSSVRVLMTKFIGKTCTIRVLLQIKELRRKIREWLSLYEKINI